MLSSYTHSTSDLLNFVMFLMTKYVWLLYWHLPMIHTTSCKFQTSCWLLQSAHRYITDVLMFVIFQVSNATILIRPVAIYNILYILQLSAHAYINKNWHMNDTIMCTAAISVKCDD